jgi:hypothetical protein
MKAEDIVRQLQAVLPKVTGLFSDAVSVSSLTRSGTTVTAVTSTVHGLTTDASINIVGAKSPIVISSLTFADGIATAITATAHDLTERFEDGKPADDPSVVVSGATEAEYNGSNPLLTVPNRTKFTYTVTGTPSTPATGSPQLLEEFSAGYNGRHTITVVNSTTFTYEITQTPNSPAQGTIQAHKSVRVSRSVSIERAIEAYTAKNPNKLWAFVVLGDTAVSKDRHVANDSTTTQGAGTEFRQRMIPPFSIFVIVPATSEIAAAAIRDSMEDVRASLFKSLLRVKFDSGLQSITEYGVVSNGDGFFDYNGAIYVHQFLFETVTDIIYADTVDPDNNVAFRNVELQYLDEFDVVELSANVDLDEEPN